MTDSYRQSFGNAPTLLSEKAVSSYISPPSPRRKPVRQQSTREDGRDSTTRESNGTVSTAMSYNSSVGRLSEATNITQPATPAYSKKFVVKYVPTVFENYITHTTHQPTGKAVELALWDTAGQEEYDRLRPLSYPETDLLFVCFAIDCPNSLENVMDKWFPEVTHFCPNTPLILVGLKSDLRTKRTCVELLRSQGLTPVTPEQGQAVARQMGAAYIECSAKEGQGIDDVFQMAINTAVQTEEESYERQPDIRGNKVKKAKKRKCNFL
ncbi:hypothetical protein DV737_g170, partial [Chaetothyriales sp. CBS 132003]